MVGIVRHGSQTAMLANCHDGDAIGFDALLAEFRDYRFGVDRQTAYTDDRVFRRHISPKPEHAKAHSPEFHPVATGLQTRVHEVRVRSFVFICFGCAFDGAQE